MELLKFAEAVATYLGERWTATVDERGYYARLSLNGVESLHLCGNGYNWEKSERVIVTGCYPRYGGSTVLHGAELPEITCAVGRGPEAVAGDIEKRFLPKYWSLMQEAEALIERYTQVNERVVAAARNLAKKLSGNV